MEEMLGLFLLGESPEVKKNYSRGELIKAICSHTSFDEDYVEDIVHDNISKITEPIEIEGFHLYWNRWMDILMVSNILTQSELEDLQLTHSQVIDQVIREKIKQLSPRAFEYFIGRIMDQSPSPIFSKVRVTPSSGDGGLDVAALETDPDTNEQIRIIAEAKHWAKPIGPAVVDRLITAMNRESEKYGQPIKGIIVTINGYTKGAYLNAKGKKIEFWDIDTLVRLVKMTGVGMKTFPIQVVSDEWIDFGG